MSEIQQLENDVGYVRELVERSETKGGIAAIYYLWAVICVIGFALCDFVSGQRIGLFWMIAGPAGWIVSCFLGMRAARRSGQMDSREGIRHGLHWGLMLLVCAAASLLGFQGVLEWPGMGPTVLLIVAFGYLSASIHLDRLMLYPGLLMLAGYVIVLYVETGYVWTITGSLVALGLVVSGLVGGRSHAAQEAA